MNIKVPHSRHFWYDTDICKLCSVWGVCVFLNASHRIATNVNHSLLIGGQNKIQISMLHKVMGDNRSCDDNYYLQEQLEMKKKKRAKPSDPQVSVTERELFPRRLCSNTGFSAGGAVWEVEGWLVRVCH